MKIKVGDLNSKHIGMWICAGGTWERIHELEITQGWTTPIHQYKRRGFTYPWDKEITVEKESTELKFTPEELQMIINGLHELKHRGPELNDRSKAVIANIESKIEEDDDFESGW